MSRLPSTRPLRFAGPLLSRIVISRDLRSAALRLRRSVRMRPLDTPPTPSAPSGPGRFVACPRSKCYDKVQTVVHVTKLVPKLEPTEECVDVPKEVCTRSRTNPRKVKKPVVKKWCYVPSEESGLGDGYD